MKKNDAADYYDHFSATYERGREAGYHALIDEIETGLVLPYARGKDCLELGCGTGLILQEVAKVASSARGIDISPGMLEKARARGLDVELGSVTKLPYEDASFDLVYSFKVLAHVEQIGRALAEAARVTRPGGHMAVEFYNPLSLRYLAKRLAGPGAIGDAKNESDLFTRWDPPWVIERLLPAGTKLVDLRGVRVVTPAAAAHRVPVIGQALAALERRSVMSRLRYFGGFLVAIVERV